MNAGTFGGVIATQEFAIGLSQLGTDGSNPSPSGEESGANLTFVGPIDDRRDLASSHRCGHSPVSGPFMLKGALGTLRVQVSGVGANHRAAGVPALLRH
jgi:hypothetical protein